MSDLRDCMMCDEFAGEKDDDPSLNEGLLQVISLCYSYDTDSSNLGLPAQSTTSTDCKL